MRRVLLSLVLMLALASPLLAQEVNDPLFSMKRVSLAVGFEYESLRDYADVNKRWFAVLPFAYNLLSPQAGANGIRLSLVVRPMQSFDLDEPMELYLGARATLIQGGRFTLGGAP